MYPLYIEPDAAEALYLLFMNEYFLHRFSAVDLEQVSSWLVECPWEGEIAAARSMREQICTKLNRTLPTAPVSSIAVSKKSGMRKPMDELDSYSSLYVMQVINLFSCYTCGFFSAVCKVKFILI